MWNWKKIKHFLDHKVFVSKIRTKCTKEDKNDSYKNKHYRAIAHMNKTVILEDSSSSSSAPSDEEDEFLPPAKKKLRSNPRLKPLDQTLTSTWDREQLSIRQAIAHGNVKTLEDRVAVLVTGKDFKHLLGVPVAQKGTGEQMAEVVIREVHRFGLSDNIIGMSFDTTWSNTGLIQGACTRIERELGRTLLWLACCHHIHELILKGVFEECCNIPSSGPDIQSSKICGLHSIKNHIRQC
ncbi:unnamed protein product [Psylliodes chrysocephalus]|uniref:Cc8K15.2-like protein n=1 Tax=Psylliodes chrysocephalus TaxID=3402493 RepID=A0A9P0CFN6_9CUCU|nr:unnamed protein product [Psylliodes chrysocephala]